MFNFFKKKLTVKDADEFFNTGNNCYNKGDVENAIKNFQKAIELNPNHAEAYAKLGLIWYRYKEDYNTAIKYYLKAIEVNPNLAEAHFNLGNAYWQKSINKMAVYSANAIKCYLKVIELNPNHAEAYSNLGNEYYHKGDEDISFSYMIKAAKLGVVSAQEFCDFRNLVWK